MSIGPPPVLPDLGPYELLGKIAEGGMGAVYMARHRDGGPVVAVKVLPQETARNQLLMRRFEQEFRAASLIDHPNVVKAIEYCGAPPTPFLVMEYVSGCSVGEKVERDGRMSEAEAVHVIRQVCEGLHCAHKQGLIHRDVKPDNVLVTPDLTAKLTDLGLVRDVESEENLTRTGRGLGTPHFMAPEQFRNAKSVDVRSDVYALGATLYMMVTGKVPYARCSPLDCWLKKTNEDFPTPKELAPDLSDRLDFAIRRAMRANPADRQASCREFMEDVLGGSWRVRTGGSSTNLTAGDRWYMVYYEGGTAHTVKGSTESIRQGIQTNELGDLSSVLVSRSKSGPFVPLKSAPEFRDLVLTDPRSRSPNSRRDVTPLHTTPRQATHTPPPEQLDTSVPAGVPNPTPFAGGKNTQVLADVPMTRDTTLHLRTDERPRLQTGGLTAAEISAPKQSIPWAVVVVAVLALVIGVFLGLSFS